MITTKAVSKFHKRGLGQPPEKADDDDVIMNFIHVSMYLADADWGHGQNK